MTKDGGPAFPGVNYAPSDDGIFNLNGMSLRDYFAAQALQAIILKQPVFTNVTAKFLQEEAARSAGGAFIYAEAMLKERAK